MYYHRPRNPHSRVFTKSLEYSPVLELISRSATHSTGWVWHHLHMTCPTAYNNKFPPRSITRTNSKTSGLGQPSGMGGGGRSGEQVSRRVVSVHTAAGDRTLGTFVSSKRTPIRSLSADGGVITCWGSQRSVIILVLILVVIVL